MSFVLALTVGVSVNPTVALAAPSAVSAVISDPFEGQSVPFAGQAVTLSGDLGAAGVRPVVVQYYKSKKWKSYAKGSTDADGGYSFQVSTTSSSRKFRVEAAKSGSLKKVTTPEVTVKTQSDSVSIDVMRLGSKLLVSGSASPVIEGRVFALQVKSGSKWVDVTSASASAAGALSVKIDDSGSKSYRWVGEPVLSESGKVISKGATSKTLAFKASPSKLGTNVIYATTDNGGTPTVKGKVYAGKAILVSGDEATAPLPMEISVRGNSSATKVKKPYKLKFVEKQKPFKMKNDRTWILLANYGDWSLIRTRIAMRLGRAQSGLKWTPDERFTELYLNGKYLGSYQMIQSIKIDNNRVNIDKVTGQVMEHDPHWVTDENEGFVGVSKMNYEFKDPDSPDVDTPEKGLTKDRMAKMKTKILQFESVLYTKDWSKIKVVDGKVQYNGSDLAAKDDWTTYLDMDSAVDYILTREFTKDNDADFYRSNFFYTNNYLPFFEGKNSTYKYDYTGETSPEKFFMGPIWDFDRSAGAAPVSDTGIHLPTGWWTNGNGSKNHDTNKIHWFTRIWKDPRFVGALKARWADKKGDYKAAANAWVDEAVADLGLHVAVNDRVKWASGGTRYKAKASNAATEKGYKAEIDWLKKWYNDRYEWMNKQLS